MDSIYSIKMAALDSLTFETTDPVVPTLAPFINEDCISDGIRTWAEGILSAKKETLPTLNWSVDTRGFRNPDRTGEDEELREKYKEAVVHNTNLDGTLGPSFSEEELEFTPYWSWAIDFGDGFLKKRSEMSLVAIPRLKTNIKELIEKHRPDMPEEEKKKLITWIEQISTKGVILRNNEEIVERYIPLSTEAPEPIMPLLPITVIPKELEAELCKLLKIDPESILPSQRKELPLAHGFKSEVEKFRRKIIEALLKGTY